MVAKPSELDLGDGPARASRLFLIDGNSLAYRAYYALPEELATTDGFPTNALLGFANMLMRLLTDYHPEGVIVAWDTRPVHRLERFPGYKASRKPTPSLLKQQQPYLRPLVEAFGYRNVELEGYEADDVIGTLVARHARRGGRPIEVVTGDRDLFQLVDDERAVRVLYTAKGVRDAQPVDEGWLRERYGVRSGPAYADLAVLRGDPSDGLPGVPGIGEKTASGLLAGHGDLAGLLAAVQRRDAALSAGQLRKLQAAADYLAVAPRVVRVASDAPVAQHDDRIPTSPADPDAVLALAERWGLAGSLTRLVDAL
jgi:5'-3' exonuclease